MLYGQIQEVTFPIRNPRKEATLRIPTSDEIIARLRQSKSRRVDLGRRSSKTESVPNTDADLALFAKLRVEGADFDGSEAEWAIGLLLGTEVIDGEVAGDDITVTLKWHVAGEMEGETKHTLRLPTLSEWRKYQKAALVTVDRPHNVTELRFNLPAAVDLYDALAHADKTEGYADGVEVPPHHKSAVVSEVSQAFGEELDLRGVDPKVF